MPFPVPILMPALSVDVDTFANTLTNLVVLALALLLLASAGLWLFFPQGDEQHD